MQTLNINTGGIRLAINGDETRIISFNPEDIGFIDRFYRLISSFEGKQEKYEADLARLEEVKETDTYGLPVNVGEYISLLKGLCEEMRQEIDNTFGSGTSQAAFGDALELEMFAQFFEGITPYIEKAREGKVNKYIDKKNVLK